MRRTPVDTFKYWWRTDQMDDFAWIAFTIDPTIYDSGIYVSYMA